MGEMMLGEPAGGEAGLLGQCRLFAEHGDGPLPRDDLTGIEERDNIEPHATLPVFVPFMQCLAIESGKMALPESNDVVTPPDLAPVFVCWPIP